MKKYLLTGILLLALPLGARAEVKPHAIFADNMVLQQGPEAPVWGTAREGEEVTVEFAGQKQSTTARDGKWMVKLTNLVAGGPHLLTIRGDNEVRLKNVLVGEVWVCSGQSNMARTLVPPLSVQPRHAFWTEEAAQANYPQIRQFKVGGTLADAPAADVKGQWEVCSPQTAPEFSAVGYFFARELQRVRQVPVGIIVAAVGATGAATWTPREALQSQPELSAMITRQEKVVRAYPELLAAYRAQEPALLEKYRADLKKAQAENSPPPREPSPPANPATSNDRPSALYNSRIAPLQPYAIAGVLWYQGENNAGHARQYQVLFPALIKGWRRDWGRGDFPFLFVQLAPYKNIGPAIREAQLLTWQSTPHTAMVVLTDAADGTDVHPPDKRPVGLRLALAARAIAYRENIEYSGPLFQGMQVQGERVVLTFSHAAGLTARGPEVLGFEVAGADRKFVPATARIDGDTVVLTAPEVKSPVAVRFGWANIPAGNLYNAAGLPASPFRTDKW